MPEEVKTAIWVFKGCENVFGTEIRGVKHGMKIKSCKKKGKRFKGYEKTGKNVKGAKKSVSPKKFLQVGTNTNKCPVQH